MSRTRAIAFSVVGGAVAALLTANIAFADGHVFGGDFGRHRRDDGLMFFFPLLMLIAVAALLVVLWRGRHPVTPVGGPPLPTASPTLNAQAILADRLARGTLQLDMDRIAG